MLRGEVVDSATGHALSDALVTVDEFRTIRTGADGVFRLALRSREGLLRVRRIGYESRDVLLDPADGSEPLVVRLAPRPIQLVGITVQDVSSAFETGTLTPATIRQTPALVEPDAFRAIAFLPGVLQASDLRGRLFLAGGRSDETGIRLDGHPLQSPFHFSELLSSFNVAALERVDVQIHRIDPEQSDRLSGMIDLASRTPEVEPAHEAVVSLLSSSFTAARPRIWRGVGLLVSGRVSYWDKVAPAVFSDVKLREVPLYGFADGIVTASRAWSNGVEARLTGFATADQVDAVFRKEREGSRPYTWGERMAGGTLAGHLGLTEWEARTSWNRGTARFSEGGGSGEQSLLTTSDRASATLEAARRLAQADLEVAAVLDHYRVAHEWSNIAGAFHSFSGPPQYSGRDALTVLSGVAGISGPASGRWLSGADLRISHAGAAAHMAASVWTQRHMSAGWTLSASLQQRLQFDAELGEPSVGFGRAPVFLLERPRRADVLGIASRWTGGGRLSATGEHAATLRIDMFYKRYRERSRLVEPDTLVADARPISERWEGFPELARESGRSYGIASSARVTPTEWLLLQGQYTYQRAFEQIDGATSPTSWDAPHQAAGIVSLDLPGRMTASATGQLRSGLAITRVAMRIVEPTPQGEYGQRYVFGDRNAERLPHYARVDAGLRRSWGTRREWTLAFQVQNLFFRSNPTDYRWFQHFCRQDARCEPLQSSYETWSLPLLPSVGLEVKW